MSLTAEKRWLFLSPLPLEVVCERLRKEFELSQFRFDCEVDSQWGVSERDGVEINVTQVTLGRAERLEELPTGFPDYNFHLIISLSRSQESLVEPHWFLDRSVVSLSEQLAALLDTEVHLLTSRWGEKSPRFMRFPS